jgi:two-component system LytT family response regulator
MKIRTLIVDDEPLARERLRTLLEAEPDIEVVGECGDGRTAVEMLQAQDLDLVFLDIQMPELDGFEVLEQAEPQNMPVVVFVTAFSQHAIKAFEVHALDYLLKPFDRDRFRTALDRARTHLKRAQTGELNQKLTALLADLRPETKTEAKPSDRLVIKSGGKVLFVKTAEIDWVEADDNYLNLHVGAESHMLRETMANLETRLNPSQFLRISRSTMVNVERIKELQPMFHGDYTVILRNGTRLTLSRGYREKLQHLLGK